MDLTYAKKLYDDRVTMMNKINSNRTNVNSGVDRMDLLLTQIDDLNTRIDALMARTLNVTGQTVTNGFTFHATNKDNVRTTAGTDYTINGKPYTLATTAEITTTAATQQAALKHAYYLCCVDAAGAFTFVKGDDADTAAAAVVPARTADTALVGAFLISLANAATFTLGTTLFDASDVTATFYPGPLFAMIGPPLTALGASGLSALSATLDGTALAATDFVANL